jgi:hypothetical protein
MLHPAVLAAIWVFGVVLNQVITPPSEKKG